jgi:hypothetical protein
LRLPPVRESLRPKRDRGPPRQGIEQAGVGRAVSPLKSRQISGYRPGRVVFGYCGLAAAFLFGKGSPVGNRFLVNGGTSTVGWCLVKRDALDRDFARTNGVPNREFIASSVLHDTTGSLYSVVFAPAVSRNRWVGSFCVDKLKRGFCPRRLLSGLA